MQFIENLSFQFLFQRTDSYLFKFPLQVGWSLIVFLSTMLLLSLVCLKLVSILFVKSHNMFKVSGNWYLGPEVIKH